MVSMPASRAAARRVPQWQCLHSSGERTYPATLLLQRRRNWRVKMPGRFGCDGSGKEIFRLWAQSLQQLSDGLCAARGNQSWGYLRQWLKNKQPLGETWVGELEMCRVDDMVAVEQEIEVQRAGAVLDAGRTVASEGALQAQQLVQQRFRGQLRGQRHYAVGEHGLVAIANRLGLVESGAGNNGAQRSHGLDRGGEGFGRLTGVTG